MYFLYPSIVKMKVITCLNNLYTTTKVYTNCESQNQQTNTHTTKTHFDTEIGKHLSKQPNFQNTETFFHKDSEMRLPHHNEKGRLLGYSSCTSHVEEFPILESLQHTDEAWQFFCWINTWRLRTPTIEAC